MLTQCPKAFVGQEMVEPINFAGWAMKGNWPVQGGLLDQAAWFVDMVGQLESAQNEIDAERANRS